MVYGIDDLTEVPRVLVLYMCMFLQVMLTKWCSMLTP